MQQDVGRLDVAMDDAALVGVAERLGDLPAQAERHRHRQLAFAGQPGGERLALDHGHHVIEDAVGLARVVHREDVRMIELGGDLDFAEEAVGPERGRELGSHHLHCHLPVVLEVLGQKDRGHPAFADDPFDPVAFGQHPPHLGDLDLAGGHRPRRHARLGRRGQATAQTEARFVGKRCVAGGTHPGRGGHGTPVVCGGDAVIYGGGAGGRKGGDHGDVAAAGVHRWSGPHAGLDAARSARPGRCRAAPGIQSDPRRAGARRRAGAGIRLGG